MNEVCLDEPNKAGTWPLTQPRAMRDEPVTVVPVTR